MTHMVKPLAYTPLAYTLAILMATNATVAMAATATGIVIHNESPTECQRFCILLSFTTAYPYTGVFA